MVAHTLRSLIFVLAGLVQGCTFHHTTDEKLNPAEIQRISQVQGTFDDETGVFRANVSRADLQVRIGGIRVTPALGLTAWMTLSGTRHHALLLGDLPLLENEVNGALRVAIGSKVGVTSLHNAFLMDSPRVLSLHLESSGTEAEMSAAMGTLLRGISTRSFAENVAIPPGLDPSAGTLTAARMESLLWKGKMSDGVYQVTRASGASLKGQLLGASTGVRSWAAFAGSEENAVVNGDLATLEPELSTVLRKLIESKISVSSIHTHMTEETPRLMFVHFWGTGKVAELADGVKKAFETSDEFQSK